MRTLDENKKRAIGDAAIHLINTLGFADTSMSKIAKKAKVSPATIYIYFKNKEDMLNKVFLMVKKNFGDEALRGFDPKAEYRVGFQRIFMNMYHFFISKPAQFLFMEQFAGSPLVKKVSREEAYSYYKPIFEYINKGVKDDVIKKSPPETVGAYFFYPLAGVVKTSFATKSNVGKKELQMMFDMAWDAVSK